MKLVLVLAFFVLTFGSCKSDNNKDVPTINSAINRDNQLVATYDSLILIIKDDTNKLQEGMKNISFNSNSNN